MKQKIFKNFKSPILYILLIFICYTILSMNLSLSAPDEYRYGDIPLEMMQTGNYFTPTLNYLNYFEKPILYYWNVILSYKIFGVSALSLRLISYLSAILIIILTYFFIKHFSGITNAILTIIFLSSSLLFFIISQIAIIDMYLTLYLTIALYSFYLYYYYKKNFFLLIFNLAITCGYLTKGLISIVFPIATALLFLFIYDKKRIFKFLFNPLNLIFIISSIVYLIIMEQINPGHFDFYIMDQHIYRFLKTSEHNQNYFYYFGYLFAGIFPYSILFFFALKKIKNIFKNKLLTYFFIWISFILLFFTISKSKLPTYIIPIIPQTCFFLAYIYKKIKKTKITILFLVIQLILSLSLILVGYKKANINHYSLFFIFILYISTLYLFFKNKNNIKRLFIISLTIIFSIIILLPTINSILFKSKNFDKINKVILSKYKNKEIFGFRIYLHSLNYYLHKQIKLVEYTGELEYGIKHNKNKKVYYSLNEFKKYTKNLTNPILIVSSEKENTNLLYEILKEKKIHKIYEKNRFCLLEVKNK